MKVVHMTNTDPSFSPLEHSDQFRAQLENLEKLGHAQSGAPCDLTEFDEETERLLRQTFGNAHECVETYGLATTAEALVNLLKSSQEYLSHDFPQKALQQRRQVLHAAVADLEHLEKGEAEAYPGNS